jgi:hypothetical protein
LTTVLMVEVAPPEGDALMHTGYRLAMLAALWCALCQFGMLALYFGKSFLFFAEEARVLNLLRGGERGEGFESDVNAHLGINRLKPLRFTLNGEAHVPLACRGARDGTRLDLASDLAVVDHPDTPDFRETHAVIMGDAKAALREGETIVAISTTETGISRVLACLDAAKKALKARSTRTATFCKIWECTPLSVGRCSLSSPRVSI